MDIHSSILRPRELCFIASLGVNDARWEGEREGNANMLCKRGPVVSLLHSKFESRGKPHHHTLPAPSHLNSTFAPKGIPSLFGVTIMKSESFSVVRSCCCVCCPAAVAAIAALYGVQNWFCCFMPPTRRRRRRSKGVVILIPLVFGQSH